MGLLVLSQRVCIHNTELFDGKKRNKVKSRLYQTIIFLSLILKHGRYVGRSELILLIIADKGGVLNYVGRYLCKLSQNTFLYKCKLGFSTKNIHCLEFCVVSELSLWKTYFTL